MSEKITFPDDWSKLSDEQVLGNIQYLQKNYKKYKISKPDDKHIKMDNIVICRDNESTVANSRICFTINNKTYYRNEENGKELIDLIHLCKMHMLPFKDKAKRWLDDNKDLIVGAGGTAVIFLCIMGLVYFNNKAAKNEKQELKREIINEVIDSLHKEQQKTINYNDSIKTR